MLFLPLHFLLCTLKLVVNVVFLRQMPGLSPACLVALKEKSGCVIIATLTVLTHSDAFSEMTWKRKSTRILELKV